MRCGEAKGTVNALVIGYGNDLRSDDGAGRVVVDRIESMGIPGVRVISLPQLTPELTLQIADADCVVFVDASVNVTKTTLSSLRAEAGEQSAWTHFTTPGMLLAMAGDVGSAPECAYAISIPAADLGLGFEGSQGSDVQLLRADE